ncbi:hypothetical protein [Streptomyces fulvoviolaceus]|uniref:hypothetical protein n=1 Tax=Streptomyces fulvoviolaceus TaxID=285535 RepID=UPI000AE5CB0B|nr:hypothetical protein [Streptomyces fulvoviolaceus]MCT9081401.1 hypothetical protein [Streptomyces fulvoviolaceus]
MSRPPQDGNGAYGANDATGADGIPAGDEPQGVPNVYHPRAGSTPAYEEYTDPAIAHGWQNAYDETAELPPVAGGESAASGRSAHRRPGGRRRPSAWRSRRMAVVAGAAGAASAAALIAGFAFSGSSSGDAEGKRERTSPAAGDSASTRPSDGTSTARSSDAAVPSAPKSPSDSASPSASADGTGKPTTGSPTADPTSTTPTATASTTAPGNSDGKPGRGQGGTKGPK